MRRLLATAVALAPLLAVTGARAEVVISTARTTPIQTSNATGTAADSIRFASGGTITLASGVAVTVDSNNSVDLDSGSTISMPSSADGSTAILVGPAATTGGVIVGGTVSVTDNIDTYPDTDTDGDLDGPLANGANRYGVRLTGTTALTGNVLVESTGNILVEGSGSRAVSIERALTGNLTSFGTLRAVGTNAAALATTANVSGAVNVSGTANAQGEGASAVSIQGDVGGRLTLQGAISSTGYRYTTRPTAAQIARLEPDDLLQGGSTIVVAGNVAGGVVLDTRPADTNAANTDEDADGILDANEGNSEINAFGSAPALTIGSATRGITLGVAGTGNNAYGLINRGGITATGVYDSVAPTAVQVGVAGGQSVAVTGGIRNEGTILAVGSEAGATGIRIGSGVTAPRLDNTNSITAGAATTTAQNVVAVDIAAGANLPAINNTGSILASATGGVASTTAIRDASGTLTSITNSRSVQALLSANETTGLSTGATTAVDVTANTTGVTYRQFGIAGTPTAADPDTDGDGVLDSQEPLTIGALRFGSGADQLLVENGVVAGDVSFGAGADRLAITGGGRLQGAVTDTDGLLSVEITNGTLDARQTSRTNATSLTIGSAGDLIVTVDPATPAASTGFRVNGTATLAEGAGVGVRFNSLITNAQRFTVIDADTLVAGAIDQTAVQANSPYLFVVTAGADVAAGDVYIDARRRTADEAGLTTVEAQAFDAVYANLAGGGVLLDQFIAQGSREGFIDLYEQVLPDHSGGPLLSLASGVDAVTRALTGRNASVAPGETSAWLQEINFYADKDKTDTYGFRSEGFGVAGGVERGSSLGTVGVSLAFTSSDIQDPEAEAEEVLTANLVELGLYWRAQGQAWTTWARAAGGYATFDSTRRIVTESINLQNTSSWNGFTLALAGGASYERNIGRLSIRPEVYAEYFSLSEDGHVEEGPEDSFNLEIDSRDGHLFSTVAAVNIGYGFGQNGWIRPELRLGWRQNISVEAGETRASFISSGSSFTLTPDAIEGGGPIAGLSLSVGNDLGKLSITADAEQIEDYVRYSLLLRASFRF